MKSLFVSILNSMGLSSYTVLLGYLRKSGWMRSVSSGRPVDGRGDPIPWFTYACIHFLQQRIEEDMAIFEYGSGMSTLWWGNRVSNVVSVEDNAGWYNDLRDAIPSNVRYLLRDGEKYVNEISSFGQKFDVVVVDGSNRKDCCKAAIKNLKGSGVIILDDSDDERFSDIPSYLIINGFSQLPFYGMAPINGCARETSIFYKRDNVLGI